MDHLANTKEPHRVLFPFTTSEVNWAAVLVSLASGSIPFSCVSLGYRLDHHVRDSEHLLVGPPDVKGVISGAEDVCGTAITYYDHSSNGKDARFSKFYFHSAFFGWLAGYVVLAALRASNYLIFSWEFSGMALFYISYPFMIIFMLAVALVRGEVRKVWSYEEDWTAAPTLEDGVVVGSATIPNTKEKEEGKPIGVA